MIPFLLKLLSKAFEVKPTKLIQHTVESASKEDSTDYTKEELDEIYEILEKESK
jgi:hypothetical protein